ncbi:MAG: hypothetical protein ISS01_03325 [Nanoarchaeota archaeon]|nr:hypothetical protein [Nanoarchaeota archaeon]
MLETIPLFILIPLVLWSLLWKGIALWKTGRNNQLVWFLFILIINTAGILPIIYLLFFQKKTRKKTVTKKKTKTKKTKKKKR